MDIRQCTGWEAVFGTAGSGGLVVQRVMPGVICCWQIWMSWMQRGTCDTVWVTPEHSCLCRHKCGRGAAVRPQTQPSVGRGVLGLWSRVASLMTPWRAKEEVPSGANQNRYINIFIGTAMTNPCSSDRICLSQDEFREFCRVQGVSSREAEFSLFDFGWTIVTSLSRMVWLNQSTTPDIVLTGRFNFLWW